MFLFPFAPRAAILLPHDGRRRANTGPNPKQGLRPLSFIVKLALLLFVAGLYLIGSGCYDLFVQAGTSRQPTTISVAELEKSVPANRHLIITSGQPVKETAVTFYRTKWGRKVSGSEILFIPITDASAAAPRRSTPCVLLRVTADQIDAAQAGSKIDFQALEGIRTTSMDLEDKVRRRLVEAYGQGAVDRMIILNYRGTVGIGAALAKLAGGAALACAVAGAFVFLRKGKSPTPALSNSIPPVIPTSSAR